MKIRALAALALPALMLAACSGDPEPAPVEDNFGALEIDEPAMEPLAPPPLPVPTPIETPTPVPTPETFPDEEQIQFDAEATGMTSRVDRNAPADQPVQE